MRVCKPPGPRPPEKFLKAQVEPSGSLRHKPRRAVSPHAPLYLRRPKMRRYRPTTAQDLKRPGFAYQNRKIKRAPREDPAPHAAQTKSKTRQKIKKWAREWARESGISDQIGRFIRFIRCQLQMTRHAHKVHAATSAEWACESSTKIHRSDIRGWAIRLVF